MKAFNYANHGADSVVSNIVHPLGESGAACSVPAGQLLIKVHASSLNPADWKTHEGGQAALLRFDWPRVWGFDFAGVVEKVPITSLAGDECDEVNCLKERVDGEHQRRVCEFKVGDKVFGMIKGLPQLRRGTLAEYVLVESEICALIPVAAAAAESPVSAVSDASISSISIAALPPSTLSTFLPFAQAAAVPLVGITSVLAFETYFGQGQSGYAQWKAKNAGRAPKVLILGGAGGVGSFAIQLAKHVYGASYVASTASKGVKMDLCLSLGADRVVDYRTSAFEDVLFEEELYDFIFDTCGDISRSCKLLRKGGGAVSIDANPTVQSVRTWLKSAGVQDSDITFGVQCFLQSSWGGALYNLFSGGRKCTSAFAERGGSYSDVIGTGNGRVMKLIAKWMMEGKIRAVIDSEYEFTTDSIRQAVSKLKSGRSAGKIIVNVIGTI